MASARPKFSDALGTFEPESRQEWRSWLAEFHSRLPGIWLVYRKVSTGLPSVSYGDAVEEALCFGWIDTTVNPIDPTRYRQLFTVRKVRSTWSKLNKTRVAALTAAGAMMPAGLAAIERAKMDGSWESLDAVEALILPPDLEAALRMNPRASERYHALSPSRRKMILYALNQAKRPETRAARIAAALESLLSA
jgi:uncharacterized protein YdeI (YjbR/CyaY-like superfamily)